MGNTFKNLQTWAIIAVLYMVVIITLSKVSKKFERRINRGR
jgi:polar amino acid transport system permease protein/polar amino acid transport system substrate-binding protein